ncbi:hypothetical protein M427DRAFT_247098 [Gonapodya prolifera JEL478]|uniref:Uncharacterized protein n=1 Tax=Gonapodya prolifera (strain JEL478) TaxID=1344416 RepID=A0A139AMY8_GONPJ|nr:hypothetical protein M427DRAFT_247098 [Gonapodya prolifera JEL478]|eukprot:KXS17835.1 hypothetical protein M427DRAFT_247098 [Gonapodya prolifera JEL478]
MVFLAAEAGSSGKGHGGVRECTGVGDIARRVGIVNVLLEKGASVEGEVQWRVANPLIGTRIWTADEWQHKRWNSTFGFPSALAAAVGRRGIRSGSNGFKSRVPDGGSLQISLRGGTVTVNKPTKWQESLDAITVQPGVDIVRLLLMHDARVTSTELEAA